jgi:hypothetical protein
MMYDAGCEVRMGQTRTRRTTVAARTDSLDTLQREAERRGISLSALLAEAVDEKAEAIRKKRRPRLGIAGSEGRSAGAAILTENPVADDPR